MGSCLRRSRGQTSATENGHKLMSRSAYNGLFGVRLVQPNNLRVEAEDKRLVQPVVEGRFEDDLL